MFSVGVGWLGWTPQVTWITPLPELFLAMDARLEWTRMTHPFATAGKPGAKLGKPIGVADKLRAALSGRRQE